MNLDELNAQSSNVGQMLLQAPTVQVLTFQRLRRLMSPEQLSELETQAKDLPRSQFDTLLTLAREMLKEAPA